MRTAAELAGELESLAHDFNAMMDSVRADGVVDFKEAALGKEYADVYRAKLGAIKKEASQCVKDLRTAFRDKARTQEVSGVQLEDFAGFRAMGTEALAELQPYQDIIQQVDQLLIEATLTREAFSNALTTLKQAPDQIIPIAPIVPDEDLAIAARESQAVSDLLAELNDAVTKWQRLAEEADKRIASAPNAEAASHLRGIKKAFDTAIADVTMVLVDEDINEIDGPPPHEAAADTATSTPAVPDSATPASDATPAE